MCNHYYIPLKLRSKEGEICLKCGDEKITFEYKPNEKQ